jgi:hypothetical protein
MKGFVLSMLSGVGIATAVTLVGARVLLPESSWPASAELTPVSATQPPAPQVGQSFDLQAATGGQFTPYEAVEVVAARLGSSAKAERMRFTLRMGARVEYHSPGHWTVRLNESSWTAHGVGTRYAEPDNEAAWQFEQEAARP